MEDENQIIRYKMTIDITDHKVTLHYHEFNESGEIISKRPMTDEGQKYFDNGACLVYELAKNFRKNTVQIQGIEEKVIKVFSIEIH